MKMPVYILFIFSAASSLFCQAVYVGEIGRFSSASAFSYNPAGFFFITDAYTNELIKIDTSGRRSTDIGGYGWQEASFDNPVDVFANTLNVYVADKNNNRIQIFDKDLNYLTSFSVSGPREEAFGYPLSCCVSTIGDLFILDGENKKIIKFDQNGRFLLQFGSYDSGEYFLSEPGTLTITADNKIVVQDDESLVFFDQFGTGLSRLNVGEMSNINVTFNYLVFNSAKKVFYADLRSDAPKVIEITLPEIESEDIVEGIRIGNKLFLLTPKNILIFKIEKG